MPAEIRPVARDDAEAWLRLRSGLWPEASEAEHRAEIETFFFGQSREPLAVLVAAAPDALVGFIELSIRPYAEGCVTRDVAYVEGWYVAPGARKRGIGRRLIEAAERWARAQGCSELASDAEAGNAQSIRAHRAVGFEDVGLIRCFRKSLVNG